MNGPRIILDKSALQSLSKSESFLLHKYFLVNVPPILVLEILGDLKKLSQKKAPRKLVTEFAGKLLSGGHVNVHFRRLLSLSLIGNDVPMDGRVVVQPGRSSQAQGQGQGVVVDASPEQEAILRWKAGEFKESEEVLAERWREITRSIDLERLQRELRAQYSNAQQIQTPEELLATVDAILADMTDPLVTLRGLFEELGVEQKTMVRATQRWQLYTYLCTSFGSTALIAHKTGCTFGVSSRSV